MKITEIRCVKYVFPIDRVFTDANAIEGRNVFTGMVVYVDTDDGVTGINPFASPGNEELINSLGSLIIGKDPRGVTGLWKLMIDHVFKGGNRGSARWRAQDADNQDCRN